MALCSGGCTMESGKGCVVKKTRKVAGNCCSYPAFTLIELLVVIAIIGLLLAILIPSLKKAQEQVRTVVCRSHLKGIGTALLVYLETYEGRAYNSSPANGFQWYNARGDFLSPKDGNAYWGVAYKDFAETPDVFGCPSYAKVAQMLYGADPKLAKEAGFALNTFFFRDSKAPTTDINYTNRKIAGIKAPAQFIITQDHTEPKIEGNSDGNEQNDMMYIPSGRTVNLGQYRSTAAGGVGGREDFYWGIFRHNKRSRAADEPTAAAQRITDMDKNPNGLSNTLWLDGHAEPIRETIGTNIFRSFYAGQN
jgi:prepilin-type N-terminal cleavage/methylation domain-containing protein/prepilin-type processing-associated H-X9-DG protein